MIRLFRVSNTIIDYYYELPLTSPSALISYCQATRFDTIWCRSDTVASALTRQGLPTKVSCRLTSSLSLTGVVRPLCSVPGLANRIFPSVCLG